MMGELASGICCPECRHPLHPHTWTCARGHVFPVEDGVVTLFSAPFAARYLPFQQQFSQYRATRDHSIRQPAAYPPLPYGPATQGAFEWRLRQYDLALVRRLLSRRSGPRRILEIGAWNGWLTHWLAADGHAVAAVDYFADEWDGLRAMKHYNQSWLAMQMDLEDLSILPADYDVVIVNRCLQFYVDPLHAVAQARARLVPGGLLLLTGLAFMRDTAVAAERAAAFRAYLQAEGVPYFKTFKGYLDFADHAALRAAGVRLRWQRALIPANLKSWLRPASPRYYYGLWRRGPDSQL